MPRLALAGLSKRFGDRVALADVSFAVDDGEMLTMLGPSGSGKTTLLRTIAGLDRPDAGRITLGARDVTLAPPRARNIGLVFQDFALFPHLSVRANIGFGVRAGRAARVAAVAARLRVDHLLDRAPARLSGGERQRVAVARALAVEPAALLFDEPFASLDAPLRALLRSEIAELRDAATMPAIFVTHDQDEALALGDRVAIVENGRIVALDTPHALLAAPPTAFVARFLGRPPANVFTGRVADGRFVADRAPGVGRDRVPAGVAAIAIRPERVRVAAGGVLSGRVRFVETIGTLRYATIAAGELTVVAVADAATKAGMLVACDVDARECWMYDARGMYVG